MIDVEYMWFHIPYSAWDEHKPASSVWSRLLYYNINYADCLESEVDDRTTFIIYDIYGMTEIYGTYRFL